jgi:hypothetical protein
VTSLEPAESEERLPLEDEVNERAEMSDRFIIGFYLD